MQNCHAIEGSLSVGVAASLLGRPHMTRDIDALDMPELVDNLEKFSQEMTEIRLHVVDAPIQNVNETSK